MGNCFAGIQKQGGAQICSHASAQMSSQASVQVSSQASAQISSQKVEAIQASDTYDMDELREEAKITLQRASASGNLIAALAEILPMRVVHPAKDVENVCVEEPATVMEKEAVIEQLQEEEDFLRHLLQGPVEKQDVSVAMEASSERAKCTWQSLRDECTWQSLRDEVTFQVGELVEFEYDEQWKKGVVTSTMPLRVRYVILHDDEGLEYDNVRKISKAGSVDDATPVPAHGQLAPKQRNGSEEDENILEKQEVVESNEKFGLMDLCLKAKHALLTGADSGRLQSALEDTSAVDDTSVASNGNHESLETSVEQPIQAEMDPRPLVKQTLLDGLASGKLDEALRKRRLNIAEQDIEGFEDTPLDRMDLEELRSQAKYTLYDGVDSGRLMTVLDKVKSNYLTTQPVSPSRGGS